MYDAVIIGGGSTGWATALKLRQRGLDVVVVDKRDEGGARWLNQVPCWCFDDAGLPQPTAPVRWGDHHGAAHITVAGSRTYVQLAAPAVVHVDMRALVADLRGSAIAAGARTMRGALRGVVMGSGRVESVELEGGDSLRARLFVDASGLGGALRTRVLGELCPPVTRQDICTAAEAQYRVRDRDGLAACLARHGVAPGDSIAFLSVAGGYSTLSLFTEPSLTEIGVLAGSIPATGAPNGAALLAEFSERATWLGERLYGGQAAIPLRRPYAILGRAGVALVGDAACQVYATHGSGVGMGLCAAALLADAVDGDPGGQATLESYTQRFHRRYGGVLAGSDAFRRLSQSLPRQTITRLLEAGILDARTLTSGIEQRLPSPDAAWIWERAARSLRAPRAVARVGPTLLRMLALSALGPLAPSPRTAIARGYQALMSALVGKTAAAPVEPVNLAAVLG